MSDGIYRTRSEVAKDSRDRRLREWFEKRRWRIMTEMSGERRQRLRVDGEVHTAVLQFDQGEFWITTEDAVFQTPFGYLGRHGFLIVELDPHTGEDITFPSKSVAAFGYKVLAKVQERWTCFPGGLPAERKHPPRSA